MGLGTAEGSAWPDVAGWLQGGRSKAPSTVCPTLLRKHCLLSLIGSRDWPPYSRMCRHPTDEEAG